MHTQPNKIINKVRYELRRIDISISLRYESYDK